MFEKLFGAGPLLLDATARGVHFGEMAFFGFWPV